MTIITNRLQATTATPPVANSKQVPQRTPSCPATSPYRAGVVLGTVPPCHLCAHCMRIRRVNNVIFDLSVKPPNANREDRCLVAG